MRLGAAAVILLLHGCGAKAGTPHEAPEVPVPIEVAADARAEAIAALWQARTAIASGDATTAIARLRAVAPLPVVLGELARAQRLAGDEAGAAASVAAAMGDVGETWIAEQIGCGGVVEVSDRGAYFAAEVWSGILVHDGATGLVVGRVPERAESMAIRDDGQMVVSDHEGIALVAPLVPDARPVWLRATAEGDFIAEVPAVAFSPDGATVAIADSGSLELVTTEGTRVARLERPPGSARIYRLDWRGSMVVAHLHPGTIAAWRTDGKALSEVAVSGADQAVALSHAGDRIAVAGERTVALFDTADGQVITSVTPDRPLYADAVGFVGDTVLAGSATVGAMAKLAGDGTVIELEDSLPLLCNRWEDAGDGTRIRTADGSVIELAPESGQPRYLQRTQPGGAIAAMVWDARGETLAISAGGDMILARAGGVTRTWYGGVAAARSSMHARAGTTELWWTNVDDLGDRRLLRWDVTPVAEDPAMAGAAAAFDLGEVRAWALTADGARRYTQVGYKDDVEIRDLATDAAIGTLPTPPSQLGDDTMSLDRLEVVGGDRLLVGAGEGRTVVWNLKRKVINREIEGALLAVSSDGRWLAASSYGPVAVIDLDSNAALPDLAIEYPSVAAFSPDGKRLAIGTRTGTVVLYDTSSWEAAVTIDAGHGEITAVAWRPDGTMLAIGGAGGVVHLRGADGSERATLAVGVVVPEMVFLGPPDHTARDWLVRYPDGTVGGTAAGLAHLAVRIGATPVGLGVVAPARAPEASWTALFEAP